MDILPNKTDNFNHARILAESCDPVLISYYEKHILGTPLADCFYDNMKSWFMSKIEEGVRPEISFINIVYYVLDIIQQEYGPDSKSALKAYVDNKRYRKKYLFQVIDEEYKGKPTSRNPLYLNTQADRYFELQSLSLDKKENIYSSKQEYIDSLYWQISQWKNDSLSLLVEFYYFNMLQDKRRYECFLVDMALNLLRIVTEQYNGRFDGGVTSLPRELVDSGIFALKNDSFPFESKMDGNKRISTNVFCYTSEEDGSITTITTSFIDTVPDKNNSLMTSHEVLNSLDKDTLTTVYTSINAQTISDGWLTIPGKEFASSVLKNSAKKLRNRDVIKVAQSINKLATANMEITKHTKDGKLISTGNLHFFEANFKFYHNNKEDVTGIKKSEETEMVKSGVEFQSTDFELMDLCNDDWEINIAPSTYLKDQWKDAVNSLIYTSQYRKLSSHKTRSFMWLVQNERLKNYPEQKIFLTFSYLRNSLRMNNMRPGAMKKEIESHIMALLEENIIIQNYSFKTSGLELEFLPFTESEMVIYKISPMNSSENEV